MRRCTTWVVARLPAAFCSPSAVEGCMRRTYSGQDSGATASPSLSNVANYALERVLRDVRRVGGARHLGGLERDGGRVDVVADALVGRRPQRSRLRPLDELHLADERGVDELG